MANPTIEIDLGEILGEIRQDLKRISSDVSDIKVSQARLEEKVSNLEKDYSEFKESTKQDIVGLKESNKQDIAELKQLIERNNSDLKQSTKQDIAELKESNKQDIAELKEWTKQEIGNLKESNKQDIAELKESIKEIKITQETLIKDVVDLKGAKSLIIPIVVAVTTSILTLVIRMIPLG